MKKEYQVYTLQCYDNFVNICKNLQDLSNYKTLICMLFMF